MPDVIPIPGLLLATIGLVLLSLETGFFLGRRGQRADKVAVSGAMAGTTLGLLAFMLAFTFNSAEARHQTRKAMVVDEANAIQTTWLRAGFMAEPARGKMRDLLRDYVNVRVKAVTGALELTDALRQSDGLHDRMWQGAEEASRAEPNSIAIGLFVQSLNEVLDLHVKRLTVGVRNRVPGTIWLTLYLLMVLAMSMMGIQIGHSGARRVGLEAALALSFAIVLSVIADLDRPQEGRVIVSQQAMLDLQARLNAH
jgi:hypothetical protein